MSTPDTAKPEAGEGRYTAQFDDLHESWTVRDRRGVFVCAAVQNEDGEMYAQRIAALLSAEPSAPPRAEGERAGWLGYINSVDSANTELRAEMAKMDRTIADRDAEIAKQANQIALLLIRKCEMQEEIANRGRIIADLRATVAEKERQIGAHTRIATEQAVRLGEQTATIARLKDALRRVREEVVEQDDMGPNGFGPGILAIIDALDLGGANE